MSRMNGELTWATPLTVTAATGKAVGDLATTAGIVRAFLAHERVTVVEVGCVGIDSTNPLSAAFSYRVKTRTAALIANDLIIDVFTAANAAEAGPTGNVKITNGLITNTAFVTGANNGKALRAYCEVTLNKGDLLLFEVVGTVAAAAIAFYAKAYPMSAGLIEAGDLDSN